MATCEKCGSEIREGFHLCEKCLVEESDIWMLSEDETTSIDENEIYQKACKICGEKIPEERVLCDKCLHRELILQEKNEETSKQLDNSTRMPLGADSPLTSNSAGNAQNQSGNVAWWMYVASFFVPFLGWLLTAALVARGDDKAAGEVCLISFISWVLAMALVILIVLFSMS